MKTDYVEALAVRVLKAKIIERGVLPADAEKAARRHVQAETDTFEEALWYVEAVLKELGLDGV